MSIFTTDPTIGGDDDNFDRQWLTTLSWAVQVAMQSTWIARQVAYRYRQRKDIILGDNGTATYFTDNGIKLLLTSGPPHLSWAAMT